MMMEQTTESLLDEAVALPLVRGQGNGNVHEMELLTQIIERW